MKETLINYVNQKPTNRDQIVELYKSVGWYIYTNSPDRIMEAIQNSTYVISSYAGNQLVGLVRGLSDNVSIHFIQDLLVHPVHQKNGIGRILMEKALALYPKVYKKLILTDDEQYQKLFYESLGFQNLNFTQPKMNAYICMEFAGRT